MKQKEKPFFIVTISYLSILGLLAIALGVLYYYEIERGNVEFAQAIVLPKEYLKIRAEENEFDYELLENIAFCESRWKMVKNNKSSAFGYFQIIDGTEKITPQYQAGFRKFNPYTNIDMAIYLYGRFGSSPWNESKPCWGWR